jgi:hypothetical protein
MDSYNQMFTCNYTLDAKQIAALKAWLVVPRKKRGRPREEAGPVGRT